MSRMKDLAVEIDEAGINWNRVDLNIAVAYSKAYKQKTGQDMKLIDAIRELYGVK